MFFFFTQKKFQTAALNKNNQQQQQQHVLHIKHCGRQDFLKYVLKKSRKVTRAEFISVMYVKCFLF